MVARAHQFLTFCTAPNLQAAVAFGLDEGDAWLEPMRERFERARDRMTEGLRERRLHRARRGLDLFPVRRPRGVGHRARRRSLRRRGGRAGRGRGRAAVRLRRAATRRATSSGCASARRTRRSTPGSRRWPRPRSCWHEPGRGSRRSCSSLFGIECGGTLVSRSPIDGKPIGRVTIGRSRRAPASARPTAFLQWRTVPAPRRGELVRLLGEELRAAKPSRWPGWSRSKPARSSRRASAKCRR